MEYNYNIPDNPENTNVSGSSNELKKFKKSNKKMRTLLTVSLVLLVAFMVLIGVVIYYVMDIFGCGGNKNDVFIEVREGATLKEIATELKEEDIISSETLFYLYAKDKSYKFQAGGHVFNTAMSYREICDKLSERPKLNIIKVLIPEGYELRLIAKTFEDADLVSAEEFIDSAQNDTFDYDFLVDKEGVTYKLEGFLFPATYEFEHGTSAHDIIDKMLSTFEKAYGEELSARAKELGMTDYEVVTFASVVEREAGNVDEHKRVAGVFKNRIDRGMRFQSCATVQYVLQERKNVLSTADTKIDSPYNTYMYSGLPIGPIASPSLSAIEAVLYPEEHDYYYFVAKYDGSGNVFSATYADHERAMAENQ